MRCLLDRHYITTPPLALMACPVMNAAAGDASHSAAAATSSGGPSARAAWSRATERWKSRSASRANAGLDPAGAQHVDADVGRQARARLLLKASTPPLTAAEQLRVLARHAACDVVPAHVEDRPTVLLLAHQLAGGIRARDRALEVDREQQVELALPVPVGRVAGEHVGAGVVDPHVEPAEPLARLLRPAASQPALTPRSAWATTARPPLARSARRPPMPLPRCRGAPRGRTRPLHRRPRR